MTAVLGRESIEARWPRRVLAAAAVYNIAWAIWVACWPQTVFELTGMEPLNHPAIWQCVGMLVGTYGLAYALASLSPFRHWPIVLVGLVGKILGPLGFAVAAFRGELPLTFGWMLVGNDVVWWVPFIGILYLAFKSNSCPDCGQLPFDATLREITSQRGANLEQLSQRRPVLVVFLRHAGCIFCREALADLAGRRHEIETLGCDVAVVHMSQPLEATQLLAHYGLDDLHRYSDPHCKLYHAFELTRGCVLQLFGPQILWRGAKAFFAGHPFGTLRGDGFQMPGTFVLYQGQIVAAFRHQTAADRPDYVAIAREGIANSGREPRVQLARGASIGL